MSCQIAQETKDYDLETKSTLPIEAASDLGLQNFLEKATIELKRAERYRVFVSLVVFDLEAICQKAELSVLDLCQDLYQIVRQNARACDHVTLVDESSLTILFPETPRQGAETAGKRLGELISQHIASKSGQSTGELISLEMASYPDAAGAKTLSEYLHDMALRHRN
ncbi:MAG: hypothetical protein SGI97_07065 [candidate division Zixibacteria bacterium]|nr:hypothetical protein [candidate division Zixibacteria bacterium]